MVIKKIKGRKEAEKYAENLCDDWCSAFVMTCKEWNKKYEKYIRKEKDKRRK